MLYYLYKLYFDDFQECYIGISKDIEGRIKTHYKSSKSKDKKNIKLYKFINENKLNDKMKFEVIKELFVENIQEAKIEEKKYIKLIKPYLNTLMPLRTFQEYFEEHKEDIYFKRNISNLARRDEYRKKSLEHYYKNREKRLEYMKKWKEENWEEYRKIRYRKIKCLCGKELAFSSLKKHLHTLEHTKICIKNLEVAKQKLIYSPKNICIKI